MELDLADFSTIQEISANKRPGQWSRVVTLPVWKVREFLKRRRTVRILSSDRPGLAQYLVVDLGAPTAKRKS